MILLIGGSSHTGKTLLAQKLMEKTGFPYVSLDHLKMAFIRSKMTDLTVNDDFKMRYFLWPFATEMIKSAIENKQNMIIEGCYIPGEWQDYFSEDYLKEIRCCFLVMSESYIHDNFDKIKQKANVIETRLDDNPDEIRLIKCSKEFKNDCIEFRFPYIEICTEFNIEHMLNDYLKIAGL